MVKKLKIFTTFVIMGITISICKADEIIYYQDWRVQSTLNSIEAITTERSNNTFGLYCYENQCVFYLHDKNICQPGLVSPILMSSINLAAALSIKCTQIGDKIFQILEPFNTVLNTLKVDGVVSFAVPLREGSFGLTTYSLRGGEQAIKRVLFEAAKKIAPKNAPSNKESPANNKKIPGSKNLNEIFL